MSDDSHKRRGRPSRYEVQTVDWSAIDKALVFGEKVTDPETGKSFIQLPSMSELATRHNVSKSTISKYCHDNNCIERRKNAQHQIKKRTDQKVIEKVSDSQADVTAKSIELVKQIIEKFKRNLDEDKLKLNNPLDLERFIRLQEHLLEIQGVNIEKESFGLSDFQKGHEQILERMNSLDPDLSGTADLNDGIDNESNIIN